MRTTSTRRKTTTKAGHISKKKKAETAAAPSLQPQKKGDAYKTGVGKVGKVDTRPIEQLRQAISGAVDRLSVALYENLKSPGSNPVLAAVLTTTQFAQILPALEPGQQKTILRELGLSELSVSEFVRGAEAYSASLSEGLSDDVKLNQATFAYVQRGESLNPAIKSKNVKSINFATDGDQINEDISTATEGEIPQLVEPGDVADLDAFLAAAAYLDAPWEGVEFSPQQTRASDFLMDGSSKPALKRMMHSDVADHRIVKGKDFEVLFLQNGKSGGLGTIYIKPAKGKTVDAFIKEKGAAGIRDIIGQALDPMTPKTRGAVRIPRSQVDFKPDGDAFLKALQKSGLPKAAKLLKGAPIDLTKAAYVGKATVTEERITMAAAQGFGGSRSIAPPPPEPVVFDGNRSMLQLVVKNGQIVFFNPLIDPSPASAS